MTGHVAVVGAGISGLAAAYQLRTAGIRVTVLEKSPTIGGHLRISDVAGLPADEGAESLLNRRPEAVELAREVGMSGDIVYPASVGAGLWSRGAIRPLPTGTVMGVPGDPSQLAQVLTAEELARIEEDRTLPGMPLTGDVAVGRFVADRMGERVTERLVEPLLAGVYAGHANELSLRATIPALAEAAASEHSLLAAVNAVRQAARADGAGGDAGDAGDAGPAGFGEPTPVFAGIRGGVGRLPQALAAALAGPNAPAGAEIRVGTTVRALTLHLPRTGARDQRDGARWRIEVGPAPRPEFLEADAVVVAVPPAPAARLLADVTPTAAAELAQIEQASVGIVTLALPATAFRAGVPASSGFLVPPAEGRAVKAVTLSSVKWPWLGELAGDLVVLRASVGRHRQVADLQRTDEELVAAVLADLRDALGVAGEPVDARVTRWGGALPQYAIGHVDRVATILAAVDQVPGLAICGAAYDGVGVAACIARARLAATGVFADLGVMPLSKA